MKSLCCLGLDEHRNKLNLDELWRGADDHLVRIDKFTRESSNGPQIEGTILKSEVSLDTLIGKGAYGDIYKGDLLLLLCFSPALPSSPLYMGLGHSFSISERVYSE